MPRGKRRNKITLPKPPAVIDARPPRSIRVEATPERFAKAGQDWEPANMDLDSHEIHDTVRMLPTIEALARRREITGHQYRAAERIYQDSYAAGNFSSGVVDPSKLRVDSSPVFAVSDRKLDAEQRVQLAMKRLRKHHHKPIQDMVLGNTTLVEFGRACTGYRSDKECRKVALKALQNALTDLDKVYHGETRGIRGTALASDYRPVISPPQNDDP